MMAQGNEKDQKRKIAGLRKAAEIIVSKCLALRLSESCLIITDENKIEIGRILYEEAKKVSQDTEMIEIPLSNNHGEEPPLGVAQKMLLFDVIIIPTTKSLSHTKARINASKKGARIVTMPGVTKDIMRRAINVDYDEMKETTNRIADILDSGTTVRITAKAGTDMALNIGGVKTHGRNAGVFSRAGDFGNLPEAEACLAPMHEGTGGVYVVDATQAGIGKLENPIRVTVKSGFAAMIDGGAEAEKLKVMLESVSDRNAYNIAELGIGTNKKAKITGITLEDEKALGTCHIALGNNKSFGGDADVPIHVDGIIRAPTIEVDRKVIMRDGKLLV